MESNLEARVLELEKKLHFVTYLMGSILNLDNCIANVAIVNDKPEIQILDTDFAKCDFSIRLYKESLPSNI